MSRTLPEPPTMPRLLRICELIPELFSEDPPLRERELTKPLLLAMLLCLVFMEEPSGSMPEDIPAIGGSLATDDADF